MLHSPSIIGGIAGWENEAQDQSSQMSPVRTKNGFLTIFCGEARSGSKHLCLCAFVVIDMQ